MNRMARLALVIVVAATLLTSAGCKKLQARDQLNKGVQAYKAANYERALEHFKTAVSYDPELKVAKLYLATAYAQQYVPGVADKDNLANASLAIDEYNDVLKNDPNNPNSLLGIAYLYMSMDQWDKARDYYRRSIGSDPNNPEAYYSVGVIDWKQVYKDVSERKTKVGLKIEDPLKGKQAQVCEEIKAQDGPVIEDGMKMLETAMQKREDYDDAMVYLNLLYLRKADIECNNPDAVATDKKYSNDWANKAMAARKKKAEALAKKNNQGGIILEQPSTQPKK